MSMEGAVDRFGPKLPPINLHAMAQWAHVLEYRKHREMPKKPEEPVVHKDYLGSVLEVGDAVIASSTSLGGFIEDSIKAMSPKMLTLERTGSRRYYDAVVKISEEVLLERLITGEPSGAARQYRK